MRIPRPRLISSVALLCVTHVTTPSRAADVQIDEHTLCRTALHAFDAKDTAGIQGFLDFIQNVFKALDARYTDVRTLSQCSGGGSYRTRILPAAPYIHGLRRGSAGLSQHARVDVPIRK